MLQQPTDVICSVLFPVTSVRLLHMILSTVRLSNRAFVYDHCQQILDYDSAVILQLATQITVHQSKTIVNGSRVSS